MFSSCIQLHRGCRPSFQQTRFNCQCDKCCRNWWAVVSRREAFAASPGTMHCNNEQPCMVWFVRALLWLKPRNNTNAARGKTITSKIRNWFHVDENIKTSEVSGFTV